MKIILSRKGFDSAAGGVASPIFPSGEMRSLPIPQPQSYRLVAPIRYEQIHVANQSLGGVVSDLTAGKIRAEDAAHLDPDLDRDSLPRAAHWRPIFGQAGAAERHLQKHVVQSGDIFIFYGWFRNVEHVAGRYRYVKNAPDRHIIFGWLQVERRIPLFPGVEIPPWALYHPHCQNTTPDGSESLYISTQHLNLPGIDTHASGAGVFHRFVDGLSLTAANHTRSIWRLPAWFYPHVGASRLSYNERTNRWTSDGETVLLRSAARGQEFVLDCDEYPQAFEWLAQLTRLADVARL